MEPTTIETALAEIETLLEKQDAQLKQVFRAAQSLPDVELAIDERDLSELAEVATARNDTPHTIKPSHAVRC